MTDGSNTPTPGETEHGGTKYVYVTNPKRRNGGKVSVIILLIILALGIAGAALWLVLSNLTNSEPDDRPVATSTPTQTQTQTPSPSASPTASPSPTPSTTSSPAPSTPVTSPPPVVAPSDPAFRALVSPRLKDATRGLTMLSSLSGTEAVNVINDLVNDAQNLSDQPAPAAISAQWRDAVSAYLSDLGRAKSTAQKGGDLSGVLTDARQRVATLTKLAG